MRHHQRMPERPDRTRLASQHADDRMSYVEQKSDWVEETLRSLGI